MIGGEKLENLRGLYLDELEDIYDGEHRILEALPKMEEAADAHELKDAFREHHRQTQGQVQRLERVFRSLGETPQRKTCKGIEGLLAEGEEFVKARGDDDTRDAALISAAQRVEHYEMAAYGTLRTFARALGHEDQANLLQETLDEEGVTDRKLTQLAEAGINELAAVEAE
jgi:ferritin-like metal-binding protein YciE